MPANPRRRASPASVRSTTDILSAMSIDAAWCTTCIITCRRNLCAITLAAVPVFPGVHCRHQLLPFPQHRHHPLTLTVWIFTVCTLRDSALADIILSACSPFPSGGINLTSIETELKQPLANSMASSDCQKAGCEIVNLQPVNAGYQQIENSAATQRCTCPCASAHGVRPGRPAGRTIR